MPRGTVLFGVLWAATTLGALVMVVLMTGFLVSIGAGLDIVILLGIIAADTVLLSTMGLLIERQRPGNRIAWVLGAGGALIVLVFNGFVVGATRYGLVGSDDLIGGVAAMVASTTLGPAMFVTFGLLPIIFPDGRLPGPRWRWPVAVVILLVLVPSVVGLVQPGPVAEGLPDNPIGLDAPAVVALRDLGGLLPLGLLAGAVLGVAAVATRFRRSAGVEREQMKWLLGSVAIIAVVVPLSFADAFLDESGGFTIIDAMAMASLALLPLSVGIAVLRYRLFEIDRIISRTLGWAAVTGAVAVVFVTLVLGLQAVFADVIQGQTLAVATSTLIAFALFQPIRRRVQATVDRRFDRDRYDGGRAAAAFAERVREQVDLGDLERDLLAVTAETLRPAGVVVWLRSVTANDATPIP
jgi:hypothetical protein